MGNREVELTELFRGSKSRNKVSVGEPAEGSLTNPSRCPRLAVVKHRALATGDGREPVGGVQPATSRALHLNQWEILSHDRPLGLQTSPPIFGLFG